ncbi:MAG: dicarboxylate/amino acid:cation symporter [Tissierellia bacterium]|jgi:Na+/H+-dicarboxylate symporter|nr:dicarboxylate/amino acid:cation symporter [Bacillota bacterium]NLK58587.1 dicarboxylate/amino acid:cation symporter [Tissierellia bacterium]
MTEQKREKRTISLTQRIFIGLILGAVTGVLLHYLVPAGAIRDDFLIDGVFQFVGSGFMRLLQMLVVPLVFFSLATGALSMGDTASLGKIGVKTLLFYLFTTAAAIALALLLSNFIKPGENMDLQTVETVAVEIAEAPNLTDTLLNIIPTNPVAAMANGEMLQIILFALLVGIICAMMPEKLSLIARGLNEGNDLMMRMTGMVMLVAPFGVFALIARTFSQLGFETFLPMLAYMGSVSGALVLQVLLVYMPLLILLARVNPLTFFKKFAGPMTFAFSSASSGATIPLTLNAMDNMGVPRRVSAFTIPLGATVNMDGTAIMQGCAVVFISLAYGIPLGFGDFMTVILTATLASVGTAAVPGVGLITLAMVLRSVNLPVEGIAMILGIDRILDMARTAINITGDATVTMIMARQDGSLDLDQFNSTIPETESDEF